MSDRFSISKFMVGLGSPLRPNRYEVVITPPAAISVDGQTAERVSLLCSRVVFPGFTVEQFQYTAGTLENLATPSAETVHEVQMDFYAPHDNAPVILFNRWKERVIAKGTNTLSYLDEYAGTVDIWQLDKNGGRVYGKRLFDTWPREISSHELAAGSNNEIVTNSVTLSYHTYELLEKE